MLETSARLLRLLGLFQGRRDWTGEELATRLAVTPRTVRKDIESWMQEHEWSSLSEMRGNMSLGRIPDPAAYERANFRVALR